MPAPTPTMYGAWDYTEAKGQFPYDDTESYRVAAEHLNGHGLVEDWGCGVGWAERLIDGPYRGIDGAWSRWADEVVDLRTYRSDVPCALMRHVLEHNPDWRSIVENFMASWRERAALVLFIIPSTEDEYLSGPDWPVPDIALSGPDLMERLDLPGVEIEHRRLDTGAQYRFEDVLLLERS